MSGFICAGCTSPLSYDEVHDCWYCYTCTQIPLMTEELVTMTKRDEKRFNRELKKLTAPGEGDGAIDKVMAVIGKIIVAIICISFAVVVLFVASGLSIICVRWAWNFLHSA